MRKSAEKRNPGRKKLALPLALLAAIALAAGCSQGTSQPDSGGAAAPLPESGDKPWKVALLLSSPVNDGGWAASAYAGLMMIKQEYGIQEALVESLAQSDVEQSYLSIAAEGYDVVFGHGSQFAGAAMQVAPEFPATKFIVTGADVCQAPNVASMHTLSIESGLIQGTAAAHATRSKVVGAIGGRSIPSVTEPLHGFAAGVLQVDADIQVLLSITGDFDDAALAGQHARAMMDQGADVIMYNLDAAGLGVLDAVKGTDTLVIASIADQNDMAPEHCLLSGVIDLPQGMLYLFRQIAQGKFEPQRYELGVESGCVYYVPNQKLFAAALPAQGQAAVQDVFRKLGAKELDARALVEELVPPALRVE